ncbi:MAG TPA: c-type cytochrome domain-containing protein [Oligoflexus sp.]|uniref:c-type cytochrome domain-containing protein n=1 Tax=Oligoflexus sp. TaxID=1971216 RepID=UPI002D73E4C6|nr:c-type cytochrome domain-containing protein [Oligoflexus sp.]HYX36339.1 c-type cytochrome domain-containing protein [Oligoflexus sp.]
MKIKHTVYSLWIMILLLVGACSSSPSIPVLSKPSDADKAINLPAPGVNNQSNDQTGTPVQNADLQAAALAILDKACVSCHSATNIQGNFGSLDNVEAMIASGRYLVAGSPERSLIYTKLAPVGNMPPSGTLKPEEVATIKNWISGLKAVQVVPLKDTQVLDIIQKDLQLNVPVADQNQIRYFSFHVANNVGQNEAAIDSMRKAFVKVINSLSTSPVLVKPVAVDAKKLIYRVRLDEMGIPVQVFDSVMSDFYPFSQQFVNTVSDAAIIQAAQNDQAMRSQTGTANYLVRADWFIATATLPVPYERLLQLGSTQAELDAQLGVDIVANLNANRVIRAGFKNSGVSSQNRMIERHSQRNGLSYWISYDFARLDDIENIFSNPLGPVGISQTKAFQHDGGEIIFQLANGMLGYRLVNNAGVILDKGPTSIVKQNDAPSQFLSAIVNGVSCMNCHGAGLLYKKDEIRAFAQANITSFSQEEAQRILNLYPEEKTFKDAMDRDNAFHFNALTQLGIDPKKPDPVNQAFRFFNRSLSKNDVKEELGISDATLDGLLVNEPYRTQWSALRTQGFISRQEFSILAAQAVEQSRIEVNLALPVAGEFLATPECMFASQVQMDNCVLVNAGQLNAVAATPATPAASGRNRN